MKKINKIIIRGKAKILESDTDKLVIRRKSKDLSSLFEYLNSRGYNNYPKIIEENKEEIRYKYYDETLPFYEESINDEDFIRAVADLHYKTTYFKNVSKKKYKEIYNNLIDNIDYLKDYYNDLIKKIDGEEYMSPSSYLFARNFSIINSNLIYVEKELNAWYKLVSDKTKERVVIVHNNLKRDNFIRGDNVIISWDNYMVDTPILDIYKLYKSEYKNLDFVNLLRVYKETFELTNEEIKLFNIMISMPKKFEVSGSEYKKVMEVNDMLSYLYKTNDLIKSGVFD